MGLKEKWLEGFSNAHTRRNYRQGLEHFEKHIGRDMDEYSKNLKVSELFSDLKTFWADYLKDLAPRTRKGHLDAVRLFFDEQGLEIPKNEWHKFTRRKVGKVYELTQDRAGTKDEWREIIQHLISTQNKALFLTLLSTGLRIGEMLQVKIKDLDLESIPARIRIRASYTKEGVGKRTVFLTDEARDAIKRFLKWRKGRKMQRNRYYDDEPRLFPIIGNTAREALVSALRRIGLDERDDESKRYVIHLHSTRKFFRSNCGLDDALTHALMGHSGYLDRSYLRTDPDRAGREFRKIAEPNLTFFKETMNVESVRRQTVIDSMKALNPNITDGQVEKALAIAGMTDITTGTPDQFSEFTRLLSERTKANSEQKVIPVDELQEFLDDDWLWKAGINNEKCLVERKPVKRDAEKQ